MLQSFNIQLSILENYVLHIGKRKPYKKFNHIFSVELNYRNHCTILPFYVFSSENRGKKK